MVQKLISSYYGTLKINTDITLLKDKIRIRVIIRNYMGISLLVKDIPRHDCFSVEFGELLVIIEGCLWSQLQ